MTETFKVACVQLTSARDFAPSIAAAGDLIRAARDAGADFITTPECVTMLEPSGKLVREKTPGETDHPGLAAFRELAQETGAWLLAGSLFVKLDGGKLANRSYLFDPAGTVIATYDKIHMFDVDIGDGQTYRESDTFQSGTESIVAELPWGRLGLTICYDVRFPYLHRALAKAGADFISVPAAFTKVTGEAHWHVLLRARAIETGCFVFAPAQCGTHAEGRQTFGHSLVVAPWGEVLADGGEEPGVIVVEIDPAKVAEARGKVPSLNHDRPFSLDHGLGPEDGENVRVLHPKGGSSSRDRRRG
jgi:predicted amidohydrolase